jgi:hypothetical protein
MTRPAIRIQAVSTRCRSWPDRTIAPLPTREPVCIRVETRCKRPSPRMVPAKVWWRGQCTESAHAFSPNAHKLLRSTNECCTAHKGRKAGGQYENGE